MEREAFLTWLSEVDKLSEARKVEAGEVLAGRPAGEASLAAVETGVGEDRICPHRGAHGSQWPTASRWDFNAILADPAVEPVRTVTNTPASGPHRKELWLTFGECLANGDTVAVAGRAVRTVLARPSVPVSDGNTSYPPCAAAPGVSHEALNRSSVERVRGELHIQNVNNRHSRLKDFIGGRRGIATRYLASYLRRFHLIVRGRIQLRGSASPAPWVR